MQCLKSSTLCYWGHGFVVLPVSEPTGGSIAAAALIVSASGTADFFSTEFGSVPLTCISQLRVDSPALQGILSCEPKHSSTIDIKLRGIPAIVRCCKSLLQCPGLRQTCRTASLPPASTCLSRLGESAAAPLTTASASAALRFLPCFCGESFSGVATLPASVLLIFFGLAFAFACNFPTALCHDYEGC